MVILPEAVEVKEGGNITVVPMRTRHPSVPSYRFEVRTNEGKPQDVHLLYEDALPSFLIQETVNYVGDGHETRKLLENYLKTTRKLLEIYAKATRNIL